MRRRGFLFAGVTALVAGTAGFAAYAWHPAIAPIAPPAASSFEAVAVRRGAELAAVGNCNVCHSAPGGKVFAGGLAMPTPFGTVYSTNITPDPETGIGRWSEAAFARSMREGLDREGRHLYPAFPYDHFTRTTDADNRALYAFLMTREPVQAEAPANDLPFPLNQRFVLAGWKLLFFRAGGQPIPPRGGPQAPADSGAPDALWDRGAYLAEGLGHCGACHTPRNALGAERTDAHFAGGEAEGWHAYALNADSPAAVPWTEAAMADYLRQGWQAQHGVARGSMAPVVGNLAAVPDADVQAIAHYVVSRMGVPSAERRRLADQAMQRARGGGPGAQPTMGDSQLATGPEGGAGGRAIYAAACATCHEAGRPLPFGGMHLALSTGITGPSPGNLLNVVLNGLPASAAERAPIMPGFRGTLDDAQLTALTQYLRAAFAPGRPGWTDVPGEVRTAQVSDRAASRPMVATQRTIATRNVPADPARP
jgi:mono/diheme cytochrome c family protein